MERNMEVVENSEPLREGARELVTRAVATANVLLGVGAGVRPTPRGGRKAADIEVAPEEPPEELAASIRDWVVPTVEEPFAVRYGLFAMLSVRAAIGGATNMVKREEVGVRSKHSILDLTERMKIIPGFRGF
jgi:hypothetical protein